MNKKTMNIKLVLILGILSSCFNFIFSFNTLFFLLGLGIIILSFGLFKKWKVVRIITIIFSLLVTIFYLYLVAIFVSQINSRDHFYWGIGLISYFPTLLWSVLSAIFCITQSGYFKNIPAAS